MSKKEKGKSNGVDILPDGTMKEGRPYYKLPAPWRDLANRFGSKKALSLELGISEASLNRYAVTRPEKIPGAIRKLIMRIAAEHRLPDPTAFVPTCERCGGVGIRPMTKDELKDQKADRVSRGLPGTGPLVVDCECKAP